MTANLLQQTLPDFFREALDALCHLGKNDVVDQLPNTTLRRHTIYETVSALYLYLGGVRELNTVEENTIGVKRGECPELGDISGIVAVDLDYFGRVIGIKVLDRPYVESELRN